MNCEDVNSMALDWVNNELPEEKRVAFEAHIAGCPGCRHEVSEVKQIFDQLCAIEVPSPSASMQAKFLDTVRCYKEQEARLPFWTRAIENISRVRYTPVLRLGYAIFLLFAGGLIGYLVFYRPANTRTERELAALSGKMEDMRQTIILSLLGNSSPGERMRAASYAEESTTIDRQVTDALFITLNEDPNINVRLATLDALAKYGNDPQVRQGLVQSIVLQESALVQAALADMMLSLREKRAIDSFKAVLKNQSVSDPVRQKIQTTIQTLEL